MDNIFKIKRLSDGKFSSGGARPKFSKTGKIWTSKRYIKSHLALIHAYKNNNAYEGCQIIEYKLTEEGSYNLTYFLFST